MYDVLIIGSGAAGLALALSLADDYRVALVSKGALVDGSSPRAQGGIAAVMNNKDSLQSHIDDTLRAGAGLCNESAVAFTVNHAKEAIQWLVDHGVQFTNLQDQPRTFHLTQEGGHTHRRILHAADRTGVAMVKTLAEQVSEHPNITCYIEMTAMDLLMKSEQCIGARLLKNTTHSILDVYANTTVLATGGASRCYRYTSNSNQTSGDGIAMAWRAGAELSNLEFNQFHPTTLFHDEADCFLISEALRGEGAILTRPDGTRFMPEYDDRAELAPRDIVARAIDSELKKNQWDYVLLNISHKPAAEIKRMFPTIYARCRAFDIDITKEPIPVVPAAHYTCGGVKTNLNAQTNLPHLYAIGEVACTGLHGANRMASNSLLECLVFAMSAGQHIRRNTIKPDLSQKPDTHITVPDNDQRAPEFDTQKTITMVRELMWECVGILRCNARLNKALGIIADVDAYIEEHFLEYRVTKELIECRNVCLVAKLIIEFALLRHESRGLHYNEDYPNTDEHAADTTRSHAQYVMRRLLNFH
jgi:L-aspartate oxidase